MSDFWKYFIAGCCWTALEGVAAVLTVYAGITNNPVLGAICGAVAAVAIFAGKTLKLGFPEIDEDTMEDEEGEEK